MKRRSFLYNASIGAFGFSWISGLQPGSGSRSLRISLDDFFKSIGAKAEHWLSIDPDLETVCNTAAVAWKKTGYQPLFRKFFLCRNGQKAIFILHLPHRELGDLDVSALVFEKNTETKTWQFAASLSGFQLEALVSAAVSLKHENSPERLAGLLLPVFQQSRHTSAQFVTELGAVSTKATLSNDNTLQIGATVFENGHPVWTSENVGRSLQAV